MTEIFKKRTEKLILLGLIIPIIGIVLSYYRGFNWLFNSLSDLGIFSPFFNYGVIIGGICLGIFTLNNLTQKLVGFFARFLMLISSASLILIGVFRKDYPLPIHPFSVLAFFLALSLGQILVGRRIIRDCQSVGYFTILAALIIYSTWFSYLLLWLVDKRFGIAIPEIISLIVTLIWIFVFLLKFKKKN